jgi:hypothetical protein
MKELEAWTLLFIADIVGKPGLEITTRLLPELKQKYHPDLTIANGENASDGKGITVALAKQYFELGIDVITGGNHTWENPDVFKIWQKDDIGSGRVLRPANYPPSNPGRGYAFVEIEEGVKAAVINLQGRTYLYHIDCPFRVADDILRRLERQASIVIVDFHAEATAEKMALGWYLDGRVSALIGTHTHVPTADEQILPGGTAYITDVGMTGPFDSVIGMRKETAIKRFLRGVPMRFEPATGNVKLCGVVVRISKATMKAASIERLFLH